MRFRSNIRVPILCCHQVVPEGKQTSLWTLGCEEFDRLLCRLSESGHQTISLQDLCQWQEGRVGLPSKPLILTFDDGQKGFVDMVAPILRKYRLKATLFLIAGELGREVSLRGGPPFQVMSSEEAGALARDGWDLQTHGLHHEDWTQLGLAEVERELRESSRILERISGRPVKFCAYPYGCWNRDVRNVAESLGFAGACTTLPGENDMDQDRFLWRRNLVLNWRGHCFLPWAQYRARELGNRIKSTILPDRTQGRRQP
ncbi:MAG: polysaccharide deacetylase family protein [Acidobacteria bacterium]|nr:polysaccharide deacetylase family protein [Acidobacteriota bacterium]